MGNHSRTNIITKWLNQCSGDMDNNNVHLELDQARVGIQWTTIKDILQDCYGLIAAESDRTEERPVGQKQPSRTPKKQN